MKILKYLSTGRLALGLLGAALAASALLAPAPSAEAATYESEALTTNQRLSSGQTDLKVITLQKNVNPGFTRYRWFVKNIGPQDSTNAFVFARVELLKDGKFEQFYATKMFNQSFQNGMGTSVSTECEPPAGYTCGKGILTVTYDKDTNQANNIGILE
jgi:hypothetical protein